MPPLLTDPLVWLALLTLMLLGANLWLFLNRGWESSHRATDYARLYHPLDTPTIRRWRRQGRRRLLPVIVWHRKPAQWQLLVDGQPHATLPGDAPWIELTGPDFTGENGARLEDHRHTYTLRPLPAGSGPDMEFGLTAIDRDFYRRRGMRVPHDFILIKTEVPVGRFKRLPVSHWTDHYRYLGAAKLAEADRTIKDLMGIRPADEPLVRMTKIIRHLRTTWKDAGGVPKDDFRWADPLRIYEEMRDGSGKGWCTQNAQAFTFFANRAGIATRFVFGATMQDNRLVYNGHSWAECYLPGSGRWVYVDPQASIVAVHDRRGRPLNSADLFHLCRHDALENVTALVCSPEPDRIYTPDDPANQVPFASVSRVARQEFNEQTIIKYRLPPNVEDVRDIYSMLLKSPTFAWTNFKRYLWQPAPAYSLLPTEGAWVYGWRRMLFVGLLGSVTALLIALA
ncbi:MAG: transglutaminase domain-containing protein [Opitutaceae bacterium]|nr:transglutaminase domain-containing protein [Opitutaceae bacterium]